MKVKIDWPYTLTFLGARAVEGLERVDGDVYTRCLRLPGRPPVTLSVRPAGNGLEAEAGGAGWTDKEAPPLLNRLFDLEAPLEEFHRLAERDRRLSPLVGQSPFLRIPRYLDGFEGMTRAIIGQLVSLASARAITKRFLDLFGERGPDWDGRSFTAFPSPERIASHDDDIIRSAGLTRVKAKSVHSLARMMADGEMDAERLAGLSGDESFLRLTGLYGIGAWTAEYIRMRVLGHRDAFPAGDLGIRKALSQLDGRSEPYPEKAAREVARPWGDWKAYAAFHLWRSLA